MTRDCEEVFTELLITCRHNRNLHNIFAKKSSQ